jgi:hypothetical protein
MLALKVLLEKKDVETWETHLAHEYLYQTRMQYNIC